jgi:hypothetical protein
VLEVRILRYTFHPSLVRSDGGTLDAHVVLEDGVRCVYGHLVFSGIAVGQAQVIVQAFDLGERK